MAPLTGPTSWQLDPAASTVTFTHKVFWGMSTVRGTFGRIAGSGEILADGTGRGRLEVDAASLDTKNKQRDQHLRSADFFNAAEQPQVVIDITTATPAGSDSAQASGTLTAAGKTKPIAVSARITEATDEAITLAADADIDRADFGMTWNRVGMISGLAHISVVARFVPAVAR
jgi:polyisoprenoid-binding protein YceI